MGLTGVCTFVGNWQALKRSQSAYKLGFERQTGPYLYRVEAEVRHGFLEENGMRVGGV